MRVFYSPHHELHAPESEFVYDGVYPYSESPTRARRILETIVESGSHTVSEPPECSVETLEAVHEADYLSFLAAIHEAWTAAGLPPAVIPHTFAVRHMASRPAEIVKQPGYYCFDAQTPIVADTWSAARAAASCATAGADALLGGERRVYALCRPPGHHAAAAMYGGYCYLNNAALAASRLQRRGRCRVAVLDVDYHHGNGTQEIFYGSGEVLTASIHGDPDRAYPYYSGRAAETGAGEGHGANLNIPLPAHIDDEGYLVALAGALEAIARFAPAYLVLSLGVDVFAGDPLGDFDLSLDAFRRIGIAIDALSLPVLTVQEGGYDIADLGRAVANVLDALD